MKGVLGAIAGEMLGILLVLGVILALIAVAYFMLRRIGVDVRVTGGDDADLEGRASSTDWTSRFSIKTTVADPVVYRMDAATLDLARRRIAAGEDLDAICRDINPAYGAWDTPQQEAFRRVLEAALQEGDQP